MDSFNDVLDAVKLYCKDRLVDATYTLYVENLLPVLFENSNHVVLSIRTEFLRKIVADRYMELLHEAFQAVLGFDVEIDITVPDIPLQQDVARVVKPGDYEYTFDNFIKGSGNKFAFSAAQAVAGNPSGAYNPLFIYGNSGLGKTHLLTAIKLEVQRNHPDYNILYVSCEQFTNELISAIQSGSTESFKTKYRQADMLLVDDIQFIAGKESTQEEFFFTFNELYENKKQIVIASDRPAKEIRSLAERLRTRFEWGLSADIQPPDYETRSAIIRRKADLLNLELPDDVVDYIANNLKNNIRQLEGAVKKLNAYSMLEGLKPNITVAQSAIRDILSETQPVPLTIERIISEVARTYNVSADDIRGPKRNSTISNARRVAAYVVREITGLSMEEIGKEFGGRDHSTIVYAINTMNETLKKDNRLKETVDDIIKNVRS